MKISDWKAFEKNSLRGFFTVALDSGLVIHDCKLFEKAGARWIALPSEKYTKQDNSVGYKPIVELATREQADRFRDAVLEAIDRAKLAPRERANGTARGQDQPAGRSGNPSRLRSADADAPPEISDEDVPF